ncbi:hypothetical protein PFISCL1PPCAC_28084, partial [Pristionchus fissidentatus]
LPFLVLLLIHVTTAFKILVYNSNFAHSHSNFLGSVADILVEAGHNVTSLIPVMSSHGKDGTVKSTKIHLDLGEKVRQLHEDSLGKHHIFFTTPYLDPIGTYMGGQAMSSMFEAACRETLKNDELIEKLRNDKFDVMMAENFDMCGLGSYALSFDPHSIVDRLKNIIGETLITGFFMPGRSKVEAVFRQKYGNDFPTMKHLSSNVAYVFANNEPLLDFAPPTISRVINIGGLGAKDPKPLDEHWKKVMTTRAKAVLISFGSVAPSSSLSPENKAGILKTVGAFPEYTFIWKYEEPEDDFAKAALAAHPNLVLSKWTPQNDLLNHPNMAAFISHGGMGSCMEVAQRAVPALFVPLFGDQPKNAWSMEYHGFGKVLSKFDLSNADKIVVNLKEIIENKRYRENAKIVSKKLAGKPFSSRELAIK